MSSVVGVLLIILVVAFIIWQGVGLYKDIKHRKKKKDSPDEDVKEDSSQNNK